MRTLKFQRFSMKDEVSKILRIVTQEQKLNALRFSKLKKYLKVIESKLPEFVTKEHLHQVFESLTQDIRALHRKMKNGLTCISRQKTTK